ncbi:MAG: InlB B-repeat-containing protein, partial [Candidatus Bathyarchaeota archaeon]|nr:InlB B-repeat-containing protein [Candidatus Termiticorpusculum sp.]
EGNVFNFYYTARNDLGYVVNYLEQGTGDVLASQKVVGGQTYLAEVTESAPMVSGYVVVGKSSQSLVIAASGNEIVFYYVPLDIVYYNITYHSVELSGGGVPVDGRSPYVSGSVVIVLGCGDMVRAGYVFLGWDTSSNANTVVYSAGCFFSLFEDVDLYAVWQPVDVPVLYMVHYYLQGTSTSVFDSKSEVGVVGVSVSESAVDVAGYTAVAPTFLTVVLGADAANNVFIFYYTANTDIEYTVYYYLQGTTTSVASSKIVTGQTMGSLVTESAIDLAGYAKVAPTSVIKTLDATGNVFIFYYTATDSGPSNGGSSSGKAPVRPSLPPSFAPETVPNERPGDEVSYPEGEIGDLPVWALANLVLSVVGLILAVVVLIFVLLLQRKERQQTPQGVGGKKLWLQRGGVWLFVALVLGVVGVVVFFCTEDMGNVMVWVDVWTVVNAVIFVAEIIALALLLLFKHEKNNTTPEEKLSTPSSSSLN